MAKVMAVEFSFRGWGSRERQMSSTTCILYSLSDPALTRSSTALSSSAAT